MLLNPNHTSGRLPLSRAPWSISPRKQDFVLVFSFNLAHCLLVSVETSSEGLGVSGCIGQCAATVDGDQADIENLHLRARIRER